VTSTEELPAFFAVDGTTLVARPHARGPWAVDMLHGKLLAGLLARAIEHEHGDPGMQFSRTTIDLFRAAPIGRFDVTTTLVRNGARVRAVEAVVHCEGAAVAKASAVLLRRGEDPGQDVWSPAEWDAPAPTELPPDDTGHPWDFRLFRGRGFAEAARRAGWVRETVPLVEGEELSAYQRVVIAADVTSPMSNAGSGGIRYINADFTVYLRRVPVGPWIGVDVTGHLHEDAVAVGQATLYDEDGAIGYCATCAVADTRTVN